MIQFENTPYSEQDKLKSLIHYTFNRHVYDDLTVAFSAKNIKGTLIFAINSFLYFYPYLKKNIVVFDDDSNDGTREALEEMDIRVITWSPKYRKYIENYEERMSSKYGSLCYSYKVNVMFNDIFEQVQTRYLLMNDGDVFFFDYFLDTMFDTMYLDNSAMVVNISSMGSNVYDEAPSKGVPKDYIQTLHDTLDNYKPECKRILPYRIHLFHGLLDLSTLKENNMLFDPLDDPYLECLSNPPYLDSGSLFYRDVRLFNIPFSKFEYTINADKSNDSKDNFPYGKPYLCHLGFRSSFLKLKENFSRENKIREDEINNNKSTAEMYLANNIRTIRKYSKAEFIVKHFNFDITDEFGKVEDIDTNLIEEYAR
jgi:hypothetical protein